MHPNPQTYYSLFLCVDSTDEKGVEGHGTLSVEISLEANFSLGDEPSQLFFFKQIRSSFILNFFDHPSTSYL